MKNGIVRRAMMQVPLLISLLHATPLFNTIDANNLPRASDSSGSSSGNLGVYHATPETKGSARYLIISVVLVILGGVFAGLTLGLMGQDEIYLKVISTSGTPREKRNAKSVLSLISRGKHWVLVTLLLSNVITNESLPIVLDRCLGGGWQAVVSSTVLIVIFGEIIPQSLCVKFGLQIGAFFAPFVLVLMYAMFPVAYPIASLLDYLLGEDHGTVYKKSGLKTLVTLHRTMGVERLTQDEVTIISAVLDLKEKKVKEIMTPIENVFTMSADRTLDETTVEEIFNSGFSRIPIFLPNEPRNFIGMLLVRILISYDPQDCLPVSHFPLATLPETSPNTSCLNILNYFQEGKSHMCVVSEEPGSSLGAIGVLTLEDVIEELIGEEIVDESDVFVDIHQRIMREQPGPLSKRHITSYLHHLYTDQNKNQQSSNQQSSNQQSSNQQQQNHRLIDHSSDNYSRKSVEPESTKLLSLSPVHSSSPPQLCQPEPHPHESHNQMVIPSNLASNPLNVNKSFVTIKKPTSHQASATPVPLSPPRNSNINHGEHPRPQNQQTPLYGTSRTTSPLDSPSRKERYLMKKHLQASKAAIDITKSTGESIQVTTSVPGREASNESTSDKSYNSNRDNQNVLISSSYKSTKNGIVESIITVKGVPKTIIEPAHNWDENSKSIHPSDSQGSFQGSFQGSHQDSYQDFHHSNNDRQYDNAEDQVANYLDLDDEATPTRSNLIAVSSTRNGPRLR